MDNYISRGEHEEFVKRMEEEDCRQNRRIALLEESIRQTQALTLSVEKMALSMENMLKEQKKQGERLEALEEVPKKNWDTLKSGMLGSLATALGGAIVAAIINFI
ncbi:MAG: hypothetical protein IJN92_09600 [Lachnospiraceae bacterium]|nr:hypothetical protein [Lachnospiraceae bacterium]